MDVKIKKVGGAEFAVLNDENLSEVSGLVRTGALNGVIVSRCDGFSGVDLSCLATMPQLRSLIVSDDDGLPLCLDGVSELKGLKSLHVYVKTVLEFSNVYGLTELEDLRLGEIKGQVYPDKEMPSVRKLYVDGYSGRTVQPLGAFTGLTTLELNGARRLEILDGLYCFPTLREFILSYCQKLRDLEGLRGVFNLELFDLHGAKNIPEIVIPDSLHSLQILRIESSACLNRLDWILSLRKLRSLVLMDVEVCSGDLMPLMQHSSLEHLVIRPKKKHYNINVAELMRSFSKNGV